MSVVGGFPGIQAGRRRTLRAPVNPLDLSTIVSIYPKLIDERKPTIQPGRFIIKAGTIESPAILVVGPSSWWKEIDEEQPLLEIPNSSIQVADSIVKDYCSGLLGFSAADSAPGIFWIPGEFKTIAEVKKQHLDKFNNAVARQKRYYENLVKLADSLWARTNGNPLTISDDMRLAARELQLTGQKDWMQDFVTLGQTNCPACGHLVNPLYPVCSNCHNVIDKEKAKALGIVFAEK
jgi:hypothetical protein